MYVIIKNQKSSLTFSVKKHMIPSMEFSQVRIIKIILHNSTHPKIFCLVKYIDL